MAGADHAVLRVGEEDRAAIRRRDAERETGNPRRHAVRARALPVCERLGDDERIGRVDLVEPGEILGRDAEFLCHAAPVLAHMRLIVRGAYAAVQRRVDPARDAALAREEGMADAGKGGEFGRFDEHRFS